MGGKLYVQTNDPSRRFLWRHRDATDINVLGSERAIDACGVYQSDKLVRFASLMRSFGFLGDSHKDSERKRCMGPMRYKVSGTAKPDAPMR